MPGYRFVNGSAEDFTNKIRNLPKRSSAEKRQARLERGLIVGTHLRCVSCRSIKPLAKFDHRKRLRDRTILAGRCRACKFPWKLNVPVRMSTLQVVRNKQDYEQYLKSAHWQDLRRQYWDSDRPKQCYVCNGKASDLHHRTYERLGREYLTDLVAVCRNCHFSIHDYHNAHRDQSLWQATRNYGTLIQEER